jgi:hypothetical protein
MSNENAAANTSGAMTHHVEFRGEIALNRDTPTYSGLENEDLLQWCRVISMELRGHRWSSTEQVHAISLKFRGAAQTWYLDLLDATEGQVDDELVTWKDLREALVARFKPMEKTGAVLDRLGTMKQGRRSVSDYARVMQQELAKISSLKLPLDVTANWFTKGLSNPLAAAQVALWPYKTFDELVANAIHYENTMNQHGVQQQQQPYQQYRQQRQYRPQQQYRQQQQSVYAGPQPMELDHMAFRPGPGQCYRCGQAGHRRDVCTNPAICYGCGRTGHGSRDCRAIGNTPRPAPNRTTNPFRNQPARTNAPRHRLTNAEIVEYFASIVAENRGDKGEASDFATNQ